MRRTVLTLGFYVSERMAKCGFDHIFPDIVKNHDIPHDTQISGSCFCMSSIVMRRILGVLSPKYAPAVSNDIETINFLTHLYGDTPTSGIPANAMDSILGDHNKVNISAKHLDGLVDHCKKWPAIIPYLPTPPPGLLVELSFEQHMEMMCNAAAKMESGSKPDLHSMCIAGITYRKGFPYMVCAQTWKESEVVLVPFIPNSEYYNKSIDDALISHIIQLNLIYLHTDQHIPTFPLPPKTPISYHSASCIPPFPTPISSS